MKILKKLKKLFKKNPTAKKQRDILALFHLYSIGLVNMTANIKDKEERGFILRENMILLCDYVTNILDEEIGERINIDGDIERKFSADWERIIESNKERIKNIVESMNKETEIDNSDPKYIS